MSLTGNFTYFTQWSVLALGYCYCMSETSSSCRFPKHNIISGLYLVLPQKSKKSFFCQIQQYYHFLCMVNSLTSVSLTEYRALEDMQVITFCLCVSYLLQEHGEKAWNTNSTKRKPEYFWKKKINKTEWMTGGWHNQTQWRAIKPVLTSALILLPVVDWARSA